ncbi:ABC transporter permease [Rhodospirillum rubrum]|uniref:ABC transporter permease n=1 Tax=Rhodospirillum rubrum TaxID=1085 RepID=UPI001906120B|nr:ABC transporter permease [Rhodospirillum rubrum]MBK1664590.1 ABC transporter permease [Rhodospirillum rubrum]MBK1676761.1 ABC transporter permease [Rhodospirillum rubrum]
MDFQGYGDLLIKGAAMTIKLVLGAVSFGLVLGLIGTTLKLSRNALARAVGNAYTDLFRGLPELLVVLIMYYGAEALVRWLVNDVLALDVAVSISPYVGGVLSLGLIFGAYASEVFRGAILAIPRGHVEAARAFGMGPLLTYRRIILPQVWRVALPGLGNLFLVSLKDTALVSAIGLNELMRSANIAGRSTRDYFTFLLVAAFLYLAMTMVSMAVIALLERRANRGHVGAAGH